MLTPLQGIRDELAAQRRAGVDFAAAWSSAIADAPGPWREALEATRAAWAAAYAGAPNATRGAQGIRAIVVLREIAEDDAAGDVPVQLGRRRRPMRRELVA